MAKKRAQTELDLQAGVPVEIESLDGIPAFGLILRTGMNELWGGNAHGKTRVQAAISDVAASTRKTEVGVSDLRRDGNDALVGSVTVGGRTLEISRSGAVSRKGEMLAGLHIVDPGAVSKLIDPGLVEEEPRRAAQLRALLELVPLEVSEDNLRAVCVDSDVLRDAIADAGQNKLNNMLEATRRMRLSVQAKARELEAESEREERERLTSEGRASALLETAAKEFGISDLGEAAARLSRLPALARELEALHSRRIEQERLVAGLRASRVSFEDALAYRESVRASLGPEPDVSQLPDRKIMVEQKLRDAKSMKLAAAGDVSRLESELAVARERLERRESEEGVALKAVLEEEGHARSVMADLARWKEQKLLADSEPIGPSPEEIVSAENEAKRLAMDVSLASIGVSWRGAALSAKEHLEASLAAKGRAEELREIERRAWSRLGELVTQATKVPEITLQNGYVAYVASDGAIHDWNSKYVSSGQRNGAAFRLGARCFGAGSILMIAGSIWETLDVQAKLELDKVCKEEGVFGLTEVASFSSDPLRSVHVGTAEWVESFRALYEAAVAAAGPDSR